MSEVVMKPKETLEEIRERRAVMQRIADELKANGIKNVTQFKQAVLFVHSQNLDRLLEGPSSKSSFNKHASILMVDKFIEHLNQGIPYFINGEKEIPRAWYLYYAKCVHQGNLEIAAARYDGTNDELRDMRQNCMDTKEAIRVM